MDCLFDKAFAWKPTPSSLPDRNHQVREIEVRVCRRQIHATAVREDSLVIGLGD